MLDSNLVLSQNLSGEVSYFRRPEDFVDTAFLKLEDGVTTGTLNHFRHWAACSKIFIAQFGHAVFENLVSTLPIEDSTIRFLRFCGSVDFDLDPVMIFERLSPQGGTAVIVGADNLGETSA